MTIEYPDLLLFIPILYAETHYRFKYFFSYLYKREPEVIADIPSRLEPGKPLPVLLIVKDAHRFAVWILSAEVIDIQSGRVIDTFTVNQEIKIPQWEYIHFVDPARFQSGLRKISIKINYSIGKKNRVCLNDNHRGSTHAPFPVYISSSPLPRIYNCIYGDTHIHTNYTSDQVEFAATMKSSAVLAASMGLRFFCATDHSYDLDDATDDYLKYDHTLPKWHNFLREIKQFNHRNKEFLIIPGEEVSIRNHAGKNVHCLVYNPTHFFPGSGDGAEKWPDTYCELSLPDLIENLQPESQVYAAHPGEKPPLLQRMLIRRGQWTLTDCSTLGLTGLQIINSAENNSDQHGKDLWIQTLLRGGKLVAICGSDAHGNFARYRQIHFPFFTLKEHGYHLFGQWRSGVYVEQEVKTKDGILAALKSGQSFMTNGPALRLAAKKDHYWFESGSKISGTVQLSIEALSTNEFGALAEITLFTGIVNSGKEYPFKVWKMNDDRYHIQEKLLYQPPGLQGYLRLEVKTTVGKQALSNPIWF